MSIERSDPGTELTKQWQKLSHKNLNIGVRNEVKKMINTLLRTSHKNIIVTGVPGHEQRKFRIKTATQITESGLLDIWLYDDKNSTYMPTFLDPGLHTAVTFSTEN